VSIGGLSMHGGQSVCQTQFFPRQLAVVEPRRRPTGCFPWGGHSQEPKPLRAGRFGAIISAETLCGPNRAIHDRAGGLRRRTGVSEESRPGCEIADASHDGDAQAEVSTARLRAA
jgi:hypothetical protein